MSRHHWFVSLAAAAAVAVGLFTASAAGQFPCAEPGWSPGPGVRGLTGVANATTVWDADGPGPLPARLVVGGTFSTAGKARVENVATWDGAAWASLGRGLGSVPVRAVRALASTPAGGLYAATSPSPLEPPVSFVSEWREGEWRPLGSGMDAIVLALAVMPNGDVVAGGWFTTAGGTPARGVAAWDGTSWTPLGSGVNGEVWALAVLPDGSLVAGGHFASAGGVAVSNIARWDGTAWSPLGTGTERVIYALAVTPIGHVLAGGEFIMAGGAPASNIARWDGVSWSPLGSGVGGLSSSVSDVRSILVDRDGLVTVGGDFTVAGGMVVNRVAQWDGTRWSGMAGGLGPNAVTVLGFLPSGDIFASGVIATPGPYAARWDGAEWTAMGVGSNAGPSVLAATPDGGLVAGGYFTIIDGVAANHVARWDGSVWSALGSGIDRDQIGAIAVMPGGNVIVAGQFTRAGGTPVNNIARWDGASWSPLGAGLGSSTSAGAALAVLPNGDLVAGGAFTTAGGKAANNIARWDGSEWHALGDGVSWSPTPPTRLAIVQALAVMPNGDVIAGGSFTIAGSAAANHIARWDGSGWFPLGTGVASFGGVSNASVAALGVRRSGDLIVGGEFITAGGVSAARLARWDGSSWFSMGAELSVATVLVLPNDDVVVGGRFDMAGGVPAKALARWDGARWSALRVQLSDPDGFGPRVNCAALTSEGQLAVGGTFTVAGPYVSFGFARYGCAPPACRVNCNGDADPVTGRPRLDVLDFACFQNAYALGDLAKADVGGSASPCGAPDGDLDIFDFVCFQNLFALGCRHW